MNILFIIITVAIILIALYFFLISPRMFNKPDRTALYKVRYYAHRGLFDNKTDAPENSLAAIKKAVDAGYGIEFDVQLSKDGIPIVFHDATLKRMCGVDGNVWDYTFEELRQLKLADSDAVIPTFEEVLATVDGKVPLIIEYKLDVASTKVCELANEQLMNYKGPYCIECFHPLAVLWYKKNRPDIIRGQLCMEYWKEEKFRGKPLFTLLSYLLSNVATRPDFISYKHSDASNISRRLCSMLGALPVCWTVQSQEQLEKAKKHYDLIIFDSFIPEK